MKKFFALLCIGALLFSPVFIKEAQGTVNSTYAPVLYSGPAAGPFAFSWKIFEATDLVVQALDSAGAFHTLAYNTDYTISNTSYPSNGNVILSPGGSWPTLPTGYTLVISRALPYTQLISISDYSPTPASTWNEALDRTAMIEQQLSTRAVLQATSATGAVTLPAPVANYLIGWDSTGTNLANYASTSGGGAIAVPIADSNLQTITTAGKVNTTAITGTLGVSHGGTGSTAAANGASGVVVLNGSAQLPAVDGSLLTNIPVPSGSVVQVVNNQANSTFGPSANLAWGAVATGTTAMSIADSIPTNSQGDQFMQLAITPTNASNKLKIEVVLTGCVSGTNTIVMALYQDSTVNALAATARNAVINVPGQLTLTYYMVAGTTSATTFKVRAGQTISDTFTFNGSNSSRTFGGVCCSEMTITEVKA
jgi:hypothetical protein